MMLCCTVSLTGCGGADVPVDPNNEDTRTAEPRTDEGEMDPDNPQMGAGYGGDTRK